MATEQPGTSTGAARPALGQIGAAHGGGSQSAQQDAAEEKNKNGLSVLVQVEGVCTKCESSLVFHMPKLWIQRWLNYEDQAAPVCAKCGPGDGLLKPGRTLHAYHNGEPCPLPDRF